MVITISYHHHFSVILLHMSCYCYTVIYHQIHKGIESQEYSSDTFTTVKTSMITSHHPYIFFQFEPGELYTGYLLGRVRAAVKQFCLYVFSKVFYFM